MSTSLKSAKRLSIQSLQIRIHQKHSMLKHLPLQQLALAKPKAFRALTNRGEQLCPQYVYAVVLYQI